MILFIAVIVLRGKSGANIACKGNEKSTDKIKTSLLLSGIRAAFQRGK